MVGGRLQVGVAIHLEKVVGRPGQAVEVGDGRAIRVVVDAPVARLEGHAEAILEDLVLRVHERLGVIFRLILEIGFQDVGDLDPSLFALAAHDDVDVGLLAALLRQHADMRPAQHDQTVVGVLDLWAVRHACFTCGVLAVMPTRSGLNSCTNSATDCVSISASKTTTSSPRRSLTAAR
jgi:hypothetical protein